MIVVGTYRAGSSQGASATPLPSRYAHVFLYAVRSAVLYARCLTWKLLKYCKIGFITTRHVTVYCIVPCGALGNFWIWKVSNFWVCSIFNFIRRKVRSRCSVPLVSCKLKSFHYGFYWIFLRILIHWREKIISGFEPVKKFFPNIGNIFSTFFYQ